jgi:hypothetical protein
MRFVVTSAILSVCVWCACSAGTTPDIPGGLTPLDGGGVADAESSDAFAVDTSPIGCHAGDAPPSCAFATWTDATAAIKCHSSTQDLYDCGTYQLSVAYGVDSTLETVYQKSTGACIASVSLVYPSRFASCDGPEGLPAPRYKATECALVTPICDAGKG